MFLIFPSNDYFSCISIIGSASVADVYVIRHRIAGRAMVFLIDLIHFTQELNNPPWGTILLSDTHVIYESNVSLYITIFVLITEFWSIIFYQGFPLQSWNNESIHSSELKFHNLFILVGSCGLRPPLNCCHHLLAAFSMAG